jgi:hypothetical protein
MFKNTSVILLHKKKCDYSKNTYRGQKWHFSLSASVFVAFLYLYLHSFVFFSVSNSPFFFWLFFILYRPLSLCLSIDVFLCLCLSSTLFFFPLLLQFSHEALFFNFNVHFVQWAVISIAPWRLTNFGKICHTTEILVNHLKNKIVERFLRKLQSFAELQVKMITLKH